MNTNESYPERSGAEMKRKVAAIIQARLASSRFPKKVLTNLGGHSALHQLVLRLKAARKLDDIIIAIPDNEENLAAWCRLTGMTYTKGSPDNVCERVIKAAIDHGVTTIVDITADCPLVDPYHVDALVTMSRTYDYCSNIDPRSWPDGFDIQVYGAELLERVHSQDPEAPHTGWQILNLIYKAELVGVNCFNLPAPPQLECPEMRLTLDTPQDARVLGKVFDDLGTYPSAIEIINYITEHPEVRAMNESIRPKRPEEG
jgi:spore coat polysaccharide biosynthesis protein SpsF (cytidylyltransferase family)